MTAKEYLQQIHRIESKLRRLKKRRDDIRETMYDVGSPSLDADKVQSSLSGDSMLRLIARVDDIERSIIAEMCELQERKETICNQIEGLSDDRYKDVLFQRYVLLRSWERISVDMGYGIKWIYQLHGEALQDFAKKWELNGIKTEKEL